MRRTVFFLTLVVSVLLATAYAHLQSSALRIKIATYDSATGAAVMAESIVLERLDTGELVRVEANQEKNATVFADVQDGKYRIHARSLNHQPQSAEFNVVEGGVDDISFYMDSVRPNAQLAAGEKRSPRDGSRHILQGYLVDAQTRQPVAGATLRHKEGEAVTDSDGYFRILSGSIRTLTTVDLLVQADGYQDLNYLNVEVYPDGGSNLQMTIAPGKGSTTHDEAKFRRREGMEAGVSAQAGCKTGDCFKKESADPFVEPKGDAGIQGAIAPALPKNIRVGRNCPTRTTCTSVEVYSVDTYVARVLSSEWYSCWGNVPGGMDSLRAGAVAVRSYGISFVYTPATSTYDICDTTSCQVFGTTTSTNGTNATNETSRWLLVTTAGSVARSEYSAENNNAGCGDGFTGTGTSSPCISDPVCAGFATFGHGRGLCQWGSARWSTQKRLSSSQACTTAAPTLTQPRKDWVQILTHYYTTYSLVQGATVLVTSLTATPNAASPGGQVTLNYGVNATEAVTVILGASINLNGSTNFLSDTPRDTKLSLIQGVSTVTRPFLTVSSYTEGSYDLTGAIYFDRNNSNTINSGDFVMDDRTTPNGLTLTAATTLQVSNAMGVAGQTVPLVAVLRQSNGSPIPGQPVLFSVGGVGVGSANTDATGTSTVGYTIPNGSLGSLLLQATFAGGGGFPSASGSGLVWRGAETTTQIFNAYSLPGDPVELSAKIRRLTTGANLSGITVQFRVDGNPVGTTTTTSRGMAVLTIPTTGLSIGEHELKAEVINALPFLPSEAVGILEIDVRFP